MRKTATTLVVALTLVLAAVPAAVAQDEPLDIARLAGPGRVTTAIEVSQDTYLTADTVFIATGGVYADALAAAPLAASMSAPVLLSEAEQLPAEVSEEIDRLGAETAILLGGEAALSEAIAGELFRDGLSVERIGGSNRFATAALIAERMGLLGEVLIAEGEHADPSRGWQDALSASALGATHRIPLLLVNAARLPGETSDLLDENMEVTIVGNESNVSAEVAGAIDAAAGEVSRIAGDDVYATSAAVAARSVELGTYERNVYVATGRAFPDGLVSGAAVAATRGVFYLIDGMDLANSPESVQAIEAAEPERLRIAGGVAAVDEEAEATLSSYVVPPN
ncbi:cell wall-binding repeat-containing protein [Euzebya sp.]|uniref:cell wall-binding repeat-containing protein n=1 Tax=Euzebya sp. TaxID=1971409 RepID=UPI003516A42A